MSWRPPSRIDPRKPAQDLTKRTQQIYQGRRDSGYSLPRELERSIFRNQGEIAIESFSTQRSHVGHFHQEPVRRPSQLGNWLTEEKFLSIFSYFLSDTFKN